VGNGQKISPTLSERYRDKHEHTQPAFRRNLFFEGSVMACVLFGHGGDGMSDYSINFKISF
jgi:hypothetical protein